MMDENSVQTHSQDSPDLVRLSHTDFEEAPQSSSTASSAATTATTMTSQATDKTIPTVFQEEYPNTPRPNSKKVTIQNRRGRCNYPQMYHNSMKKSADQEKKRQKSLSPLQDISPPPQNRLAFINAVKIAWLYQGKKPKKRTTDNNNKDRINNLIKKTNIPSHPPITAKALSELSIQQLFKSIQIRHDLMMDPQLKFRPNLSKEKKMHSDIYWNHLDQLLQAYLKKTITPSLFTELIATLKCLITELATILVSLISPFLCTNAVSGLTWHWPSEITEYSILTVLNADRIASELQQGSLDFRFKFNFLDFIFKSISPKRARVVQTLVNETQYAKALEYVFLTLEAIKLECANRSLHYYKPYLIETSAELEWEVFTRQLSNQEIELSSVTDWLVGTWNRLPQETKLMEVFRSGVLNLVTEDKDAVSLFNLPSIPFPITFFYDEKWLTNQMRHEFQNIIVIGLLMIPYRLIAGKKAKRSEFEKLKNTYSKILNDASLANESVSYFHLALHACNIAADHQQADEVLVEQTLYWSNWMDSNLRNNSEIYKIMYERVRSCLLLGNSYHAIVGLESEIEALRKKLNIVTDHNFRTFGSLYTYLLPTVRQQLTQKK